MALNTKINVNFKYRNILLIRAGASHRKKIKHPVHYAPCLSLKYAQTILNQESLYKAEILDYWVESPSIDDLMNRVEQNNVDLIVVSIGSPAADAALELCTQIKNQKEIPVIAIGSDVSEKYQYYQTKKTIVDIFIRGEYEFELKRLIDRLNTDELFSEVAQDYMNMKSQDLIQISDLDDLPALQWSAEELKKYPYIYPMRVNKRVVSGYVSASRGCPHGCTFCSPTVRKSYGRKLRMRSANNVVDEIENLTRLGVNVISFEDDDFVLNPTHVISICDEIVRRQLKIKWACHARADEVPLDLLRIMKNAGCELLLFGIESGSQKIVNVLHKASVSNGWREKVQEAFDNARDADIASCAMFIVGSPSETEEDIRNSIELCRDIKPNLIKVHFFTLYPGSIDYHRYAKKNLDLNSPHHYLKPIVNLSQIDLNTLKKLQRMFYKKILFRPSFVFSHLYNYLPFYLFNSPGSLKFVKDSLLFLILGSQEKVNNPIGKVSNVPVRS